MALLKGMLVCFQVETVNSRRIVVLWCPTNIKYPSFPLNIKKTLLCSYDLPWYSTAFRHTIQELSSKDHEELFRGFCPEAKHVRVIILDRSLLLRWQHSIDGESGERGRKARQGDGAPGRDRWGRGEHLKVALVGIQICF